jgi:hypothetical protein
VIGTIAEVEKEIPGPMKRAASATLFCVLFVLGNQLRATTLPDACGDDKVKFEVTTHEGLPASPTPGKAQIVFIEDQNEQHNPWHPWDTVRFGMDGTWVGANKGNSYFTLEVVPGLHHLCASWQGGVKGVNGFDLAPVVAEPGKVYYFAAEVTESQYYYHFSLSQLNEDQGKYRVKVWHISNSKPVQAYP